MDAIQEMLTWRENHGRGAARIDAFLAPFVADEERAPNADDGKIHIALLAPWAVIGGANRFNLQLLAGLDKTRFSVGLLTTLPSDNPWLD